MLSIRNSFPDRICSRRLWQNGQARWRRVISPSRPQSRQRIFRGRMVASIFAPSAMVPSASRSRYSWMHSGTRPFNGPIRRRMARMRRACCCFAVSRQSRKRCSVILNSCTPFPPFRRAAGAAAVRRVNRAGRGFGVLLPLTIAQRAGAGKTLRRKNVVNMKFRVKKFMIVENLLETGKNSLILTGKSTITGGREPEWNEGKIVLPIYYQNFSSGSTKKAEKCC